MRIYSIFMHYKARAKPNQTTTHQKHKHIGKAACKPQSGQTKIRTRKQDTRSKQIKATQPHRSHATIKRKK